MENNYERNGLDIAKKIESNTASEIENITKEISVLLDALSELEKRISPALLLRETTKETNAGVPTPGMCEIAMDIRQQSYRIVEATGRVRDMLDRLDI